MIHLQTTQKTRNALGIGDVVLDGPGESDALLGDWVVDVIPLGGRQAFLFMSARSLLSFPIMIGVQPPTVEQLPAFLSHGLGQLMQYIDTPTHVAQGVQADLREVALCRATDQSVLASLKALVTLYAKRAKAHGRPIDLGRIISDVNETPREPLHFLSPFDATQALLAMRLA